MTSPWLGNHLAAENPHQGGLSGTILAQQGVDLSPGRTSKSTDFKAWIPPNDLEMDLSLTSSVTGSTPDR